MTTPQPTEDVAPAPLAMVRYGLAKEIQLFPEELVFIAREEGDANHFALRAIRRLIMQPGEVIPSKLLLLLELDDGTTIIAAEGMTNVRAFRQLLSQLVGVAPQIALDPPDLDAQLAQAAINRRQTSLGCYGVFFAALLLIALIFIIGQIVTHHL